MRKGLIGSCVLLLGLWSAPLGAQENNWTLKAPANIPPARAGHAMAYDRGRGEVVLFGGFGYDRFPTQMILLGDTWVWNGTNWTQRNPVHSPPARVWSAMAYDAARGEVVLFGGIGDQHDTWVWNGVDWTQKNPLHNPPGRYAHAMAYDAGRGEVVLFGGQDGISNVRNDTWIWNGVDWAIQNSTAFPPAMAGHSMTYDAARDNVVMASGWDCCLTLETWTWDGANWTQQNPANSPPSRYDAAVTYDPANSQVMLFGGLGGSGSVYLSDTWTWNGTSWAQQNPANRPPVRSEHLIVYDEARGEIVLFGGWLNNPFHLFDDTWVWPANAVAPTTTMVVNVSPLGAAAATFSVSPPILGMPSSGPYPVVMNGVAPATYVVTFNPVPGFVTPPPQTVAPNTFSRIEATGFYAPTSVSRSGSVVLTVGKNGSGSGSVRSRPVGIDCGSTCVAMLGAGTHVKLEAIADPGSIFVGWSDSFCKGKVTACSFTIDGNRTFTAMFVPAPRDSTNKIIYVGVCGAATLFDNACYLGSGSYDPRDLFSWVDDPFNDTALDSLGVEYSGLDAIGRRIGRLYPTSVTLVAGFSFVDAVKDTVLPKTIKNSAESIVDFVNGVYKTGDRIHLVGHSNGGAIVHEVANILLKRGIPVAMMAEIDNVFPQVRVPSNVARAFNFYYPNPLVPFCPVSGNSVLLAEKKSNTIVSNTRIDAPFGPDALNSGCGGHKNMDNDPLVWRPILNFMVGIP